MISTARDALFNIANSWLFCDDSAASPHEARIVRESLEDALVAPSRSDDPVLAALSLCSYGRYGEAADVIDEHRAEFRRHKLRLAADLLRPRDRDEARAHSVQGRQVRRRRTRRRRRARKRGSSRDLGGDGTALRVRAEALEALGETHAATATIEDAIAALEPMRPVHHLVGAYQCAHRLTKKRAYLDRAYDLVAVLQARRSKQRRRAADSTRM